MSTPDNDPSGPEDQDAQWQAIVEGYGDHPEFPGPRPDAGSDPGPDPAPDPDRLASLFRPAWRPEEPPEDEGDLWSDSDTYVPPPPPPVPRPRGWRLVAWLGVLGVPLSLVVIAVLRIVVPTWCGVLALAWFIGGFGYLVSQMRGPDDPDSGWDDGAVL